MYAEAPQDRKHPMVGFVGVFLETIQILIIVGVISFLIRTFIVQPFYIKGSSMEPNLYENQLLLIDEVSYRFGAPQRGDIVVLHAPKDTKDYIKRVIATPGETVEINSDGQVLINDIVLKEPYLSVENRVTKGTLKLELGEDEYFVLGDNRAVSNDSRGGANQLTNEAGKPWTIGEDDIVGRAFFRWYPFGQVGLLSRPDYNL